MNGIILTLFPVPNRHTTYETRHIKMKSRLKTPTVLVPAPLPIKTLLDFFSALKFFPPSRTKQTTQPSLHPLAQTQSWTPHKIRCRLTWRQHIEGAGITQSAKNGISMNHQIHFWLDSYVSTSSRGIDAPGQCSYGAGARGELGGEGIPGCAGMDEISRFDGGSVPSCPGLSLAAGPGYF